MLKYIKVKNFLSFNEETIIDFVSNKRWTKKDNVFQNWDTTFSKSKVIYGANASGKTNILKALDAIIKIAIYSVQIGIRGYKPFLFDIKNKNETMFFEVWFFINKIEYFYNFEIFNDVIISENLYEVSSWWEINLFARIEQVITPSNKFKSEYEKWQGKVRPDASFLSVLWQFDGRLQGENITNFFRKISIIAWDVPINSTINRLRKDDKNKDIVISFLKCADIHIDSIDFVKQSIPLPIELLRPEILEKIQTDEHYLPVFGHKVKGESDNIFLNSWEESGWTNRIFALLRPVIDTIINEKILFVDEIENKLHIHILQNLLKLIHSKIDKKYQFVFTTHDVSLMDLDIFKKEQIGIVNKEGWATKYCDLSQFDVRRENDIQKLYHNWAFGGIPKTIDFSLLINDIIWAEK